MLKRFILLAGMSLVAAGIQAQSTVKGYVYEDENGNGKKEKREKGIPDVPVSNGVAVTLTDEHGRYELPVGDDNIIFVIKPPGHRVPVDENNLPQFYYIHKPKGSPHLKYKGVPATGKLPEWVNFPLIPAQEKDTFKVLVFGDPQLKIRQHADFFERGIISEVQGAEDVLFGLSLGDLVGNNLRLFDPYIRAVKKVGIPWYNVMGNHDINFDVKSDSLSDETFEARFGPANYAFNFGKVHFIILDNILYPDPRDGKGAWGGFTQAQLRFVENDLKYVPKDHLVVLAFHIPLRIIGNKFRQRLFSLLEKFPHTFSLSGHAHKQRQVFFTEADGLKRKNPHHEYNVGAASGSWYSGIFNEQDIPISMMKDGTPKGYAFVTFTGNEYVIDYKVAGKPEDYQMRISAPKVVAHNARTAAAIYVNFFLGSSRDTLMVRIDNGKWKPMEYAPGHDPAYVHMLHRWDYSDTLLEGRRPGGPHKSTHLWKAPIPADLDIGKHTIEVKVTDKFGRTFTQKSSYRIEEPIYSIFEEQTTQ